MIIFKHTPKNVVRPSQDALHRMHGLVIETMHAEYPEKIIQSQAWKDLYSLLWYLDSIESRTWLQRLYLYDDYFECDEYNDDTRQELKNAMTELSPFLLWTLNRR